MKKIAIFLFLFLILTSGLSAEENSVTISTEEDSSGEILFYAENSNLIPYYINISFPVLENMNCSESLPFGTAIPAETPKMFLFKLSMNNMNKGYSYQYSYIFVKGDPLNTVHDDDYLYLLPFEHGSKYRVDQGYNGTSTHFGDVAYSLDFNLEEETPVTAARDGLVAEIKEDSNTGGFDKQYEDDGNFVLIYHDDGTFANYVHLIQNGALVEPGDHVKAGQVIGLSGNTGYSSGPHLHFSVSKPTLDGRLVTIPTKFLDYDYSAVSIEEGQYYYSTHPGEPPFEVVFGDKITDEDYSGYHVSIPGNDDIEIRAEQIDNTILIFAQNGFSETYEVEVVFTLTNLESSQGKSVTGEIEPLSEGYICFLRIADGNKPWRYSYTYSFKPVRELKLEAEISNDYYKDYIADVPSSDSFELRNENIGNKVVMFFRNGYNKTYEIKITFSAVNLEISKEEPVIFDVPPLSEVFICYFDMVDPSKRWNISTEYYYTEK